MRLVSYHSEGGPRLGAVVGEGVVDVSVRLASATTMRTLIEAGALDAVREVVEGAPETDYRLDEIDLDLPVADPRMILCVGVNYADRNAEYRDGSVLPQYPSLFMRTPRSFVPHGADLVIPAESGQLDYEGEIVVVIGKAGRRIARADARRHIFGLTIMNEGTVRDWLRHGKFNVTQGKNFDSSGAIGPWIETGLDELDLDNLRLTTHVNGELRQDDTTACMKFPVDALIEYVSTFMTLLPGDLIATGTPTGAGARFDPPRWLKPGDQVEVSVPGIGTLRNGVRGEQAA